jgi:hypothetical protein
MRLYLMRLDDQLLVLLLESSLQLGGDLIHNVVDMSSSFDSRDTVDE